MPRERARQLLAEGNYIRLAKSAVNPKYQGIGAVLVGNHREGLAKLDRALPDAEVDYYRAFAHWCLKDVGSANTLLNEANPQHARLKSVINRKVRVLCQARHDGDKAWGISSVLKKNPSFEVVTIGNMVMDDIQLGINDTIETVLGRLGDWRPDYYFVHMIEYRAIPLGVERAPFPVIFQSSDPRSDYHQVVPLLDLCDRMLVLGEQAHRELSRGTKSRVFTYPKLFGIHSETAFTSMAETKDFDLFCSGNMLHESLYDKTTFFSHLVDELCGSKKITLCNGKTSLEEYYSLMSRAKVVPSFIHREQDSFSSRALEAIAMGAITLVPAGNAIGLYFGQSTGLVEFHPANAASVTLDVLKNWDNYYAKSAQQGRSRALAEFNFPDVVDHLFKALMLESLNLSIEERSPVSPARSSLRLYGLIEATSVYANPSSMLEFKVATLERLSRDLPQYDDIDYMAVCAHIAWECGHREKSTEIMEKLYQRTPTHPGLLFNLAFSYVHTGRTDDALAIYDQIIKLDTDCAHMSNLFPIFDFSSTVYLTHVIRDELCNSIFGGSSQASALSFLKSVAHNYIANLQEEKDQPLIAVQHYRFALECYPENIIVLANYGRFLVRNFGEDSEWRVEARDAFVAAMELYRGYLLTDVFEQAKKLTRGDSPAMTVLERAHDNLLRLLEEGEQLHTQGRNTWWEMFNADQNKGNGGSSFGIGGVPQLVEEGFYGFNIVIYGGRLFGIAQRVGPIDFASLTEQSIDQLCSSGLCYIGESFAELKTTIEGANPQRRAEALISTLIGGLQNGNHQGVADCLSDLTTLMNGHPEIVPALEPMLAEIAKHYTT